MTSRGANSAQRMLICRVGTKVCGLPIEHVVETMRPLPIEPLANVPTFVLGLALIRGRPTPVLDARELLGGSTPTSAPERFVTLELGTRTAALAVDRVLGARDLDARDLQQLPGLLRDSSGAHVTSLGMLDAELLLVLEHTRLVPEAVWQTIPSAGPPA